MSQPPHVEVPVLVHELMRAATGHPITVRTLGGEPVVLRLATVEEVLRFEAESRAYVTSLGVDLSHDAMSPARAAEQVAQQRYSS